VAASSELRAEAEPEARFESSATVQWTLLLETSRTDGEAPVSAGSFRANQNRSGAPAGSRTGMLRTTWIPAGRVPRANLAGRQTPDLSPEVEEASNTSDARSRVHGMPSELSDR